ncbi:hypothetical protein [Microbacterium dauci]|uniref:Uncharacterized protein n=1 Tax=Microbacterium dauci TaxID=3048008 RepID=A0ABT6ZAE7_9MICO|nr:hypothetical protein [Microbacterium sp. LX3-4]MDJ1113140.1 hypothetical protein [Microbacterium sp. LX3-4]
MTAPEPPAEQPPAAPAPRKRGAWVGTITDKVPTGWLTGILLVPFLAITAAFGGLNAVAAPAIPEISPGDTHDSGPFDLTVERAVLIDELQGSGASPEEGQRVLALVVTAENTWDRAFGSYATNGVTGALAIPALGEGAAPVAVARLDDATGSPFLQPGMPVELIVTWVVDAGAYTDGDEIALEIRDFTLSVGQFITAGEDWGYPVLGATLAVPVTDVGAGADAEADG